MKVEIWSDVVCPWCAIGRRRFERALGRFPHRDEVRVRWRSFQLDSDAPPERPGEPAEHLAKKYGITRERAEEMNRQLTETAAAEGLEFHLERTRGGNSFDAHRLLHLAADRGVQDAVKDRLFRAHFTEGERIGDPETLVRLGAEAGLDADEARAVLASHRYTDAVDADEVQAQRYGITGVPFFVIDGKYGVSGAQEADALLQVLDQAWAETHPLEVLTPAGETCADGSGTS